MLLVDANVLLHAANNDAPQHDLAKRWLLNALAGPETLGLAWVVVLAFLRLSTHPSVFRRPLTAEQSASLVESWTSATYTTSVEPTHRHLALLRGLLAGAGTAGNLVTDAHLAALALEYDATIVSFDRDFGRFEGVRWRLPA